MSRYRIVDKSPDSVVVEMKGFWVWGYVCGFRINGEGDKEYEAAKTRAKAYIMKEITKEVEKRERRPPEEYP